MIKVEPLDDKWRASCTDCGWYLIQGWHAKFRHKCKATGETTTYTPPDWESRTALERSPHLKTEGDPRLDLAEPNLMVKAKNFSKASVRHAAAGFPEATDEQVAERFAICQACDIFKPKSEGQGVCTHKSCGCALKAVGLTGRNKLRWADSVCPLGKWAELTARAAGGVESGHGSVRHNHYRHR